MVGSFIGKGSRTNAAPQPLTQEAGLSGTDSVTEFEYQSAMELVGWSTANCLLTSKQPMWPRFASGKYRRVRLYMSDIT